MNKKLITVILVVIVIVIAGLFARGGDTSGKPVIKIGVVAPVTGSYSAYGATLVKGIDMALADISAKDTKYKYQLVVEDDTSDSATAANAASKLINIDGVKAIITTTSGSGNAVKTQAEKTGVIHVCDCTDTTIGNALYNFTDLILPVDEGKVWLTEAKKRGISTIAVLQQVHPGAAALVNAMIPQVDGTGMKVIFNESFDGSNRDFKTLVTKAVQKKADIYRVVAYPPSLDIVSKELMDAGVKNISTMALFTTSPNPSMYNGLWYTDAPVVDPALKDRFTALYPKLRYNGRTVPYGYDIFNMLVQSFEKGGDAYANMKAITDYDGKVGKVTKTPDGTNFRSQAVIWIMKDGVPVMLGE